MICPQNIFSRLYQLGIINIAFDFLNSGDVEICKFLNGMYAAFSVGTSRQQVAGKMIFKFGISTVSDSFAKTQ